MLVVLLNIDNEHKIECVTDYTFENGVLTFNLDGVSYTFLCDLFRYYSALSAGVLDCNKLKLIYKTAI